MKEAKVGSWRMVKKLKKIGKNNWSYENWENNKKREKLKKKQEKLYKNGKIEEKFMKIEKKEKIGKT